MQVINQALGLLRLDTGDLKGAVFFDGVPEYELQHAVIKDTSIVAVDHQGQLKVELRIGDAVFIKGDSIRPDLNEQEAQVKSWNPTTGTWTVKFAKTNEKVQLAPDTVFATQPRPVKAGLLHLVSEVVFEQLVRECIEWIAPHDHDCPHCSRRDCGHLDPFNVRADVGNIYF